MAPSASVSEAAAKTVTVLLSAAAPGSAVNAKQAANSAASARRIFMVSPNKRDIPTNITCPNACQPSWLFGGTGFLGCRFAIGAKLFQLFFRLALDADQIVASCAGDAHQLVELGLQRHAVAVLRVLDQK